MERNQQPGNRAPAETSPDGASPAGSRLWERFAALALRRPWLLALLGALAFGLCVPASIHLYGDLRTDLRELLPQGAPAAVGLEQLEKRVGGLSHLAIIVRTEDLGAGERFVDALAEKINAMPRSLITGVQYRINEERAFFEKHGALYADSKDLAAVRDSLRTRVGEARGKANPLFVDLDEGAGQPEKAVSDQDTKALDQAVLRMRTAFGKLDHYLDGYLAGEGGQTLIMLVSPSGAAVSLHEDQVLFDQVAAAVKALKPTSFHPSIRVGYGGEVRSVIEAQEALVRDLLTSSVLVLLAVGGALLLYYRTWRAIPLLVLPLFTGVAMTLALSRLVIHYLNPNTAFLGSIIVGNGINAGIILLARYLEERRAGAPVEEALPTALKTTYLATFAASAAAAASYGSLGAVSFRGFNQFGFMGCTGMLLCWLATYAVMPPLIVLLERTMPAGPRRRSADHSSGLVAGPYARLIVRRPSWPVAISAGLAVLSTVAVYRLAKDPIQYDFRKLGSRSGNEDGAGFWDKHVDAVLQSYQTPTVVLTDSPQRAQAVAAAMDLEKDGQGPNGTIDSVTTLQKMLPADQPLKLALLREIFSLLGSGGQIDPRVLDAISPELRPTVLRLRSKTQLTEIVLRDVPSKLTSIFREKDGQEGRIVLVYPTLTTDSSNGKAQMTHAQVVRAVALKVDPTAQIAGQIVLTSDIVTAITSEGTFTAVLSFFGVALLTVLVMRSLKCAAWVMGSLCLGVLWMAGAMGALSLKLNFVNFAVLPITFGIGVDYAVNLYQRYRQTGSVEPALGHSGGAVALCSATTMIGYATLITADNQAIQSFGLTAVLGEITCLSAALFALPAWLAFRDSRAAAKTVAEQALIAAQAREGVEPSATTGPAGREAHGA